MAADHEAGAGADRTFTDEIARIRASGVLGASGRLRELFDYLAARGAGASPASQAEIADAVFGQPDTEGDDATARVYVHRLRKRLADFYTSEEGGAGAVRLVVPPGTYALRLADDGPAEDDQESKELGAPEQPDAWPWRFVLALAAAIVVTFMLGRAFAGSDAPPANAFWRPFLESERPIVVVIGDYYMFGEIDPVRPEQSRLIRDYRVNSPMDLAGLQEAEPDRYGGAEDVGLSYLPLSTAYSLRYVMPILARDGRSVRVVPASELNADTAREANIVYLGLLSGLGLLEDATFAGSSFAVGESYDELVDGVGRQTYTSEEARRLASPVFYRDYGYVARFEAPGGSLVAIVAGARDTALRGLAPIVAGRELPGELADLAQRHTGVEALFQVTGQQGADLSERLLAARARPSAGGRRAAYDPAGE